MVAERRGRNADFAGDHHVEQRAAGNIVNGGIQDLQFFDIFLAFEFEHGAGDGDAGVAAGKSDFVLQLRPQESFIVSRRRFRRNQVFVVGEADMGFAVDGPEDQTFGRFFFDVVGIFGYASEK